MSYAFVDLEDARAAEGIRMSVVSGIPSPWSEAAKGILHMKRIDWKAVRHRPGDRDLQDWTGCDNAPVLAYGTESFISGWADILLFAERLAPEPGLLPRDPETRALTFGLSHELMGQDGLCWLRRLQLVHGGKRLQGKPRDHADYIGNKYGYRAEDIPRGRDRIIALLAMFSDILMRQKSRGSQYFMGDTPTAPDIYSAVSMALFAPLPENRCNMDPAIRTAFSMIDDATRENLSRALLDHRDMMYERHLALPLAL